MTDKRRCVFGLFFAFTTSLLVSSADAHPHMFVDAQTRLVVNEQNQLIGLRTALVIDPLSSLYLLEANQVPPGATTLTEDQRGVIADGMVSGLSLYDYFTELRIDDKRVTFASAHISDVSLQDNRQDNRVVAALNLILPEPTDLRGRRIALAIYDPTYFTAIDTLGAPALPGSLSFCTTWLTKFRPAGLDSLTLAMLSKLSREDIPEDTRIGARFADWSTIECAA